MLKQNLKYKVDLLIALFVIDNKGKLRQSPTLAEFLLWLRAELPAIMVDKLDQANSPRGNHKGSDKARGSEQGRNCKGSEQIKS